VVRIESPANVAQGMEARARRRHTSLTGLSGGGAVNALRTTCKSTLWNSGLLLAFCASCDAGGTSAKIQIVVYVPT
jgi:hypothetical protein